MQDIQPGDYSGLIYNDGTKRQWVTYVALSSSGRFETVIYGWRVPVIGHFIGSILWRWFNRKRSCKKSN